MLSIYDDQPIIYSGTFSIGTDIEGIIQFVKISQNLKIWQMKFTNIIDLGEHHILFIFSISGDCEVTHKN